MLKRKPTIFLSLDSSRKSPLQRKKMSNLFQNRTDKSYK